MRHRVIGSSIAPATIAAPLVLHAIMMEPGGIDGSITPNGYLFPVAVDVDQMIKYRWLIRAWEIEWTSHAPAAGGFDEETIESTLVFTSEAEDESELWEAGAPEAPPFLLTSSEGTRTVGVDPPVEYDPVSAALFVCARSGNSVPPDDPELNNYYFNSTSGLYLPRVELEIQGSPATGFIKATNWEQGDDGNVNTSVQEFSGTWDGEEITIQVLTNNSHPLDSFTFTATRRLYWEYRDANGNNAIWDADTGVELGDHNTLLD